MRDIVNLQNDLAVLRGETFQNGCESELPGRINREPIISSEKSFDKMKNSATSAAAIRLLACCKFFHGGGSELRQVRGAFSAELSGGSMRTPSLFIAKLLGFPG